MVYLYDLYLFNRETTEKSAAHVLTDYEIDLDLFITSQEKNATLKSIFDSTID